MANCSETLQFGTGQQPDSGIRTAGICCSPECRHLVAGRHGGFWCSGFSYHLTRGPQPGSPFRCHRCLDLAARFRGTK